MTPPTAAHRHLVEFYESDRALAATVAEFLLPTFAEPGAAVVVATPAHRAAFEAALTALGVDVPEAAAAGCYLSLDAAELLASFLVDGEPDVTAFERRVGGLLDRLAGEGRTVRIYGEMVALLWEGGDAGGAVAVEDLWNHLGSAYDFELLCAYRLGSLDDEGHARAIRRICEQHATRPDQALLAELAYADALTTVINRRRAMPAEQASHPRPRRRDHLVLAASRNTAHLMASPGGRVLGDLVATQVAQEPVDVDAVLPLERSW